MHSFNHAARSLHHWHQELEAPREGQCASLHLCLELVQLQIKGALHLRQRASLHRCTAPTCALSPCMVRMLEGDRKLSSQNLNCPPSLATASSQLSYAATTPKCSLPVAGPETNNHVGGWEPGPGVKS